MSIPRAVVRVADGSRVPQLTVKLADEQTPAQCTLRVAESGERAQYTIKIADGGQVAQMAVHLENYAVSYAARVLALSPIAYYQLDEASGTTAIDSSGNGFDGAYINAVPGGDGIGDGQTGAAYDGTGDAIDISAMASAFDGTVGSVVVWGKTAAWADAAFRNLVTISAPGGMNQVVLFRSTSANTFLFQRSDSNDDQIVSASLSTTEYFSAGLTWDVGADALKAYINGAQIGTTQTGLVAVSGTPGAATTAIGASGTGGVNSWSGSIAHVAIFDRALSGAEMLSLGVL